MEKEKNPYQTTTGGSLFRVTEQQLSADEKLKADEETGVSMQDSRPVLEIVSNVRKGFEAAKQAWEHELHERLLKCIRQKNGQYDPDTLAKIRLVVEGGSENYRNITQVKIKSFEAWANASVFPIGDKCWTFTPSPVPELPDDTKAEIDEQIKNETILLIEEADSISAVDASQVQARKEEITDKVMAENYKRAKLAAKRLEKIIDDQLTEGGYYEALAQCILDMAMFPVCWMTGPEVRKKKQFKWITDPIDGKKKLTVIDKTIRTYRRVSPFNMFPSANSSSVQDGDLYELRPLKRSELQAMIGVEGFNEEAIRAVLQEYGTGGLREWISSDTERKDAEYKLHHEDDPNPPIMAVIKWGELQGKMLLEWGMTPEQVPDPDLDYQIQCWLIGQYVVMCRLNPSPLGTKPYYATSYDKINDSIIGNALPEVMRDDQMRCCACARAIDNNMAFASGPMIEFFTDRFPAGTNYQALLKPFSVFLSSDSMTGTNNPAVRLYQYPFNAALMLEVDKYFQEQAGEKTIPSYVHGTIQSGGGVLDTASGTSMMMNASLKNLQTAIGHFEKDIIVPSIKEHFNHVMLYDDDIEKFGDVTCVPKASEHLLVEEQRQMRAQELLDRVNASPILQSIIKEKGMATLLREVVKITKMDPNEIVPSEEDMERNEMIQNAQMGMVPGMGQPTEIQPQNPAVIAPDGGQVGKEPGRVM